MRRTDADIAADSGLQGRVAITLAGATRQMTLTTLANATAGSPEESGASLLLPPLYEPQLLSMHADGMIVRGWQRLPAGSEGPGPSYLQEWLLTFIGSAMLPLASAAPSASIAMTPPGLLQAPMP